MSATPDGVDMYDASHQRIKVGDRVRIANGRPGAPLGTVVAIHVKRVQIRWDSRKKNAKQPFTRIYPSHVEVVK